MPRRKVETIQDGTTVYVIERSRSRTGQSVIADLLMIDVVAGHKITLTRITSELADCYKLPYRRGRGATFHLPVTPETIVRRLSRDLFGEGREDAIVAEWL